MSRVNLIKANIIGVARILSGVHFLSSKKLVVGLKLLNEALSPPNFPLPAKDVLKLTLALSGSALGVLGCTYK